MLSPGERVDLWLDFSGRAVGSKLTLYSLGYSGVMPAMYERMSSQQGAGGMGMMRRGLAQGSQFPIAVFNIKEKMSESPQLPKRLVALSRLTKAMVDNPEQAIPIALSMQPMSALINGKSFAMDKVLDFEKVALGSHKYLRIFHDHTAMGMGMMRNQQSTAPENNRRGMGMTGMMSMAHPIHLHGQQFQIINRKTDKVNQTAYQTVSAGFIDSGWKDTVLVMPGEEVEIIKPFQDYKGLFLYHCHNLEHEDLGMMRQFLVS